MNLINIRKVGYGVRQIEEISSGVITKEVTAANRTGGLSQPSVETQDLRELLKQLLEQLT
jgi:hypothetical protein